MGSSGMKRSRKGKQRQHLEKVGAHHENTLESARHEQQLERSAIADTMGFGSAPGWLKAGCLIVGAAIMIVGVVTLIALD